MYLIQISLNFDPKSKDILQDTTNTTLDKNRISLNYIRNSFRSSLLIVELQSKKNLKILRYFLYDL